MLVTFSATGQNRFNRLSPPVNPPRANVPAGQTTAGQPGNEEVWRRDQVLAQEQGTQRGSRKRVRIVSAATMRDLIRVEEELEVRPDGSEVVRKRVAMAARHLLARLKPGVSRAAMLQAARPNGVVGVREINQFGLVRLELAEATPRSVPEAIKSLKAVAHLVDYVEPDYVAEICVTTPNDPAFGTGQLWALRNGNDADIDADEAWDLRRDASNVLVAVIDTGIRFTHEDLAPNIWRNPGELPGDGIDNDANGVIDDVFGYNVIARTGNPNDDNGHGTHVAGTIGAVGNNATGSVGVAWTVRLMAVKAFGSDGRGLTSDTVVAIDYARQEGARIMNNSWGQPGFSQSLADAVARADAAGVIFVAAAGNDGHSSDVFPHYPSGFTHANIVSVAASTRSDELAYFSNYGLKTVDVAAPGEGIYSTYNQSDSSYTELSGTSMAAPHASGVLAVIAAHFPTATHREIIDRLLGTTDYRPGLNLRIRTQGRINLRTALTASNIVPLPRITLSPSNTGLAVGGTLRLAGAAESSGPVGFQWLYNGFPLAGATSASLVISNAQRRDSAVYTLIASNVSGLAASDEAIVQVRVPVLITAQPQGAVLLADDTFKISAGASGDEPIWYQWRKDGAEIAGATNADFAIYGVAAAHAGSYTMRVSNIVNAVTSAPAILQVLSAPIITAQPQDQVIALGQSATFSVSGSGTAPLVFQWFRDGAPVAGATTSTLVINNAQEGNLGSYFAQVSNNVGQAWSGSAALTLKNAHNSKNYPVFTQHPTNVAASIGATVRFTATVTGSGVTYQWRKNGANIPGAVLPSLTLSNIGPSDLANYTLIARNSTGAAASRAARITLLEAPVITHQPASVEAVGGAQVVLEVSAAGTPVLNYSWTKDGQLISGATNRRLTVQEVSSSDAGVYVATVRNAGGTATSSPATISLLAPKFATSWRQIAPSVNMGPQACATEGPDGIYVGGQDNVITWSGDRGQTWSQRLTGLGPGDIFEGMQGISYGNGRFVALAERGSNTYALTSKDGIYWKQQPTSGTAAFPFRFNGSVFYGPAGNGRFQRSTDGVNWSQFYTGAQFLLGAAYGPGRFVAVGDGIVISTNGQQWTRVVSAPDKAFWDVCYGEQGFVAVGHDGIMMISTDGLQWSWLPEVTTHRLSGVAYGNGVYVATGASEWWGAFQPSATLVSTNGRSWRRVPNHATFNLGYVTFAKGVFVAYGDYGHVLTSQSGAEWTMHRPRDTDTLAGMAGGTNGLLAVGDYEGTIRQSSDGLSWNTIREPQSPNLYTVAHGAGAWVIGAQDGKLYTSSNGSNWRGQAPGLGVINRVRYLGGQFLALTASGEILISPDGQTWTKTPEQTGATLTDVAYGSSRYVAVGYDGAVLSSSDGNSWTLHPALTPWWLLGVAHGNGRFVVVGEWGRTLISSNGLQWTLHMLPTNVYAGAITFGKGKFVAFGPQGTVLTSVDGLNWGVTNIGSNIYFFQSARFLNDMFVVCGSDGVYFSQDGNVWNRSGGYILDINFGNGEFMAATFGGLWRGSTLTGLQFGNVQSPDRFELRGLRYLNGKFVAADLSGNILSSVDGNTWVRHTTGFGPWYDAFAFGAGRFIAAGPYGSILHSRDLTNWAQVQVTGVDEWNDVTYGNGQFVAVGSPGALATSTDGFTWTRRSPPTTASYVGVAYGNGVFVAVGPHALVSTDGVNWSATHPFDPAAFAVTFSGGKFWVTSGRGTMFSSTDGWIWDESLAPSARFFTSLCDYDGAAVAGGELGVIIASAPSPVIRRHPESQRVRVGSPVTVGVQVDSPGRPRYQWIRNRNPLLGATSSNLVWPRIGSTNAGEYYVKVRALGGEVESFRANIDVWQTPFDTWRIAAFGESNFLDPSQANRWDTAADPDHDLLPNIAEYALGLPPLAPSQTPAFAPQLVNGRLRLTFVRRRNDPTLQVMPEVSSDLLIWQSGPTHVRELQVTPIDGELERVTVEDVSVALPNRGRFMRLRISSL